jgi:hypothetical protein
MRIVGAVGRCDNKFVPPPFRSPTANRVGAAPSAEIASRIESSAAAAMKVDTMWSAEGRTISRALPSEFKSFNGDGLGADPVPWSTFVVRVPSPLPSSTEIVLAN